MQHLLHGWVSRALNAESIAGTIAGQKT